MTGAAASPEFTYCVQKALAALYDPSALGSSPLCTLLTARPAEDPAFGLQRILLDAIESLQPNQSAPVGSRAWRVYQILRARYTEQLPQPRVALDLALSIRQLQREEAMARSVLADHLWIAYSMEARGEELTAALGASARPSPSLKPASAQEPLDLASAASSIPVRITDVGDILQAALKTIRPLAQAAGATLTCSLQPNLPRVPLRGPLLRQALLSILEVAIGPLRGQQVSVVAGHVNNRLEMRIGSAAPAAAPFIQPAAHDSDEIEQAGQLIALCGGSLEVSLPRGDGAERGLFEATINLIVAEQATIALIVTEQATVMVIDDNADALNLLEHYLSGSPYRMLSVQDAKRALPAAVNAQPKAIVLDVMMPDEDGWTLLGALREHPKTRAIPVIVCTILAQKDLALALGAAEFMRKPVSREALLAALQRQVTPARHMSGSET